MARFALEDLFEGDAELERSLRAIVERRADLLGRRQARDIATVDDAFSAIERLLGRPAGRSIVGIGGFPGSGKTRLATELVDRVNAARGAAVAVHLPMDGFHFRNDRLRALGRDHLKGHVSTFDVDAYVAALRLFVERPALGQRAPDYDREFHEVVADRIEIAPEVRLLVTEGIYVGLPAGRWREAAACLDLSLFLDVEPRLCLERVVARNVRAGRDGAAIRAKLRNDVAFMDRSLAILAVADLAVRR